MTILSTNQIFMNLNNKPIYSLFKTKETWSPISFNACSYRTTKEQRAPVTGIEQAKNLELYLLTKRSYRTKCKNQNI
jgi:hypothetical protein